MQQQISDQDYQTLLSRVRALKLPGLKSVARAISIAQSGRKADVQDRVIKYLQVGKDNNEFVRILAISDLVQDALYERPLQNYGELRRKYEPLGSSQGSSQKNSQKASPEKKPWLFFQENPFFVLKKLMTPSAGICHRAEGRGTCRMSFEISAADLTTLKTVPSYRLYLLCGVYDRTKPQIKADIEFPTPLEITFNQTPIKDNVKGIKNRPGTAKPADLTPFINSQNLLEMVYAFTKQDFLVFCYMVEKVPPNRLLQKILASPRTPKDVTVQEIVAGSDDDDEIQEMSTVLSLKCPVSFMRMKYPVKSIYCHHLPCFDALQFIYLQEQVATWNCPYCNNKISVKDLSLNEYVLDILKNTSEDCDSVEIDLDGSWHPMYENSDGVLVRMEKPPQRKEPGPEPELASLDDEDEYNKHDNRTRNSDVPQITEHISDNLSAPPKRPSPVVISLDSDDDDFDQDPVPIRPQVRQQSPFPAHENVSGQLTSESTAPVILPQAPQQQAAQQQALHSQEQSTTTRQPSETLRSASHSDIPRQSEESQYASQMPSTRPFQVGQTFPIQPNVASGAQSSPVFPAQHDQQASPTIPQGHQGSMRIPASQTRVIPMVFAFAAPLLQNSAGQAVTITNEAMQTSLHPIVFREYLKATVGNPRMRDFTYISQIQYYFMYHQDAILNTYQAHLQQKQEPPHRHHQHHHHNQPRVRSSSLAHPSLTSQQQQLVPNSSPDEGRSISLSDIDNIFDAPTEARKDSNIETHSSETLPEVDSGEPSNSTEIFESGAAAKKRPLLTTSSVNVSPPIGVSYMSIPGSSSTSNVSENAVRSSEAISGAAPINTILNSQSETSMPSQVQTHRQAVTVLMSKEPELEKSNDDGLRSPVASSASQTLMAGSVADDSICTSSKAAFSNNAVQRDNSINMRDSLSPAVRSSIISASGCQRARATQSAPALSAHSDVPSPFTAETTSEASEFSSSVTDTNTPILFAQVAASRVPLLTPSSLIGSRTPSQNGADCSVPTSDGASPSITQSSAPRVMVSASSLMPSASTFSTSKNGVDSVSPAPTTAKVNTPTAGAPKVSVSSSGILSEQRLVSIATTQNQIASSLKKSPSIDSTANPIASQHLTPSAAESTSKSTSSPLPCAAPDVDPLNSRPPVHQSNYDRERNGLLALKKRFYELTKGSSNVITNGSPAPLPPPHKICQPSPSSLIPNLNASPLFGILNRSSSASPPQRAGHSHSPSIGSVTNAQFQLKSNLDNYVQKNNIQRANTINLPSSGSSKALDRIQDLNKNIINGIENSQKVLSAVSGENNKIPSIPTIQRAQSTNSNFSPSRFSSGSSSTTRGIGEGASNVEAPKVTSSGQNILGINIQSEPLHVVKPRSTSNIFLPSRKPPHTHLEKKRSSSGASDQTLKKPTT